MAERLNATVEDDHRLQDLVRPRTLSAELSRAYRDVLSDGGSIVDIEDELKSGVNQTAVDTAAAMNDVDKAG